jgi:integrase
MLLPKGSALIGSITRIEDTTRAKPIDFRKRLEHMPPPELAPRNLAEFWEGQFSAHLARKRPNTRNQYKLRWQTWIEPAFGDRPLADITPWMVEEWLRWLRTEARTTRWAEKDAKNSRPLAASYIYQIHTALSAILSRAVRMHLITYNPAKLARDELPAFVPSEATQKRPRRWTLADARKFFSCPGVTFDIRAARATAFYCLLRIGEVCGLRWQCVRLEHEIPHVVIEKSYGGPTKNGRPRSIPIHPELMPVLKKWHAKGWRKKFGQDPRPEDLVFPNARGGMATATREGYYRALRIADVPLIRHHGLRHSFAQLLREESIPAAEIAALLGHTSEDKDTPGVTRTYVKDSLPVMWGIMRKFPGIYRTEAKAAEARSTKEFDGTRPVGVSLGSPAEAREEDPSMSNKDECSDSRTSASSAFEAQGEHGADELLAKSEYEPESFSMLRDLWGDE